MLGALFIQVGTNLSNDYSDARRGADTEDRLGPVRVTAGGLVPPRQVLVATYVAFGLAVLARRVPDRHRGLGAAARRRGLDPRRRALHGRPAPVRLRGARRGVRVPVLRRRRRHRAPTSPRSRSSPGRRSCWPCRSGCWPRRSSSSTTCATSRPTGGPASGRSPCGSAARGRAGCTRRWSISRSCGAGAVAARARTTCRRGCCCRCWRCRSPCRSCAWSATAPTGRRSTARSPAPACSSSCSASLLSAGILAS